MRIIAGTAKGRRLYCPKGLGIRPARDRVKESLFNILGGLVTDSSVLDLFAGTGAVGIEALSRGAKSCLFVDSNASAISYLQRNLRNAGLESRAKILKMDVFRLLPHLVKKGMYFELAFVDPPYKTIEDAKDGKRLIQLLEDLAEHRILREPGIVVLEYRAKGAGIPEEMGRLVRFDERSYDATHLGFWHLSNSET